MNTETHNSDLIEGEDELTLNSASAWSQLDTSLATLHNSGATNFGERHAQPTARNVGGATNRVEEPEPADNAPADHAPAHGNDRDRENPEPRSRLTDFNEHPQIKGMARILSGVGVFIGVVFNVYTSVINYLNYVQTWMSNTINEESLAEARKANRLKEEDNARAFCDMCRKGDPYANSAACERDCRSGTFRQHSVLNDSALYSITYTANITEKPRGISRFSTGLPQPTKSIALRPESGKSVSITDTPDVYDADHQGFKEPGNYACSLTTICSGRSVHENHASHHHDVTFEIAAAGILGTAAMSPDGVHIAAMILFAISVPDMSRDERTRWLTRKMSTRRVLQVVALVYLTFRLLDACTNLPVANVGGRAHSSMPRLTGSLTELQLSVPLAKGTTTTTIAFLDTETSSMSWIEACRVLQRWGFYITLDSSGFNSTELAALGDHPLFPSTSPPMSTTPHDNPEDALRVLIPLRPKVEFRYPVSRKTVEMQQNTLHLPAVSDGQMRGSDQYFDNLTQQISDSNTTSDHSIQPLWIEACPKMDQHGYIVTIDLDRIGNDFMPDCLLLPGMPATLDDALLAILPLRPKIEYNPDQAHPTEPLSTHTQNSATPPSHLAHGTTPALKTSPPIETVWLIRRKSQRSASGARAAPSDMVSDDSAVLMPQIHGRPNKKRKPNSSKPHSLTESNCAAAVTLSHARDKAPLGGGQYGSAGWSFFFDPLACRGR